MINLLKFNGELISNGLAAMSLDCKYSKLPGNTFFFFCPSETNIERERRKEKARQREKTRLWEKPGPRNLSASWQMQTIGASLRESLIQVDFPLKHEHLLHCNSKLVLAHSSTPQASAEYQAS